MTAMAIDTLVWISGASSGIGAALAAAVPLPGAHVVDISRSGGSNAEHLPADLADPLSWAAVEAHVRARVGAFEGRRAVFFHCAGVIDPIGPAGAVDPGAYRRNVLVNAAAPQALGQAFLSAVAGLDLESHLILLSSGAATTVYEGWSAYGAGKAAVEQWVRTVGAEQRRLARGCRVLAVAPGVVDTAMQERVRSADPDAFPAVGKFHDQYAADALRSPEEVARDLWSLLDRDFDSGAVVDLRRLAA
ncbi:SDR family oxidoreductase [soil metagenome]